AGRELVALKNVQASALAVEPASGNVWVLWTRGGIGTGSTEVFDKDGQSVATYDHHGWDIAFDGKSKAFWMADRNLLKDSTKGETLVQKEITKWCASSLDVDQKTGMVWVATREYSPNFGRNELLGFDNDGKLVKTIPLGAAPFRVAVDSRRGFVWLACL